MRGSVGLPTITEVEAIEAARNAAEAGEAPKLKAEYKVPLQNLINSFLSHGIKDYDNHIVPTPEECIALCRLAMRHLAGSPMCLQLNAPLNIVGDIHGQFHDLLRIYDNVGLPPRSRYLFLGDYVDRGNWSLEVIVLLLCQMICYPNSVYLLRGNHEATSVCLHYGFRQEIEMHYGGKSKAVLKAFVRCFQWIPVCAIVSKQAFCCHGGISPFFFLPPFTDNPQQNLRILNSIRRPQEPPQWGVLCDILWADPLGKTLAAQFDSDKLTHVHFTPSQRGCSFLFSPEALDKFCKAFGVDLLIRAHQVAPDGYMVSPNGKCITLFSAPGYCGTHDNNGAILQIKGTDINLRKPGNFIIIRRITDRPLKKLYWMLPPTPES